MNKQLAKISKATLEIKERGILNFWIYVDYEEGGSQAVGGIALDKWSKEKQERVGTAYGCEVIRRLLIELCVNDFSEMAGRHIWVFGEGDDFGFQAKGLQALRVDNRESMPVIFSDILADMQEKESKDDE